MLPRRTIHSKVPRGAYRLVWSHINYQCRRNAADIQLQSLTAALGFHERLFENVESRLFAGVTLRL